MTPLRRHHVHSDVVPFCCECWSSKTGVAALLWGRGGVRKKDAVAGVEQTGMVVWFDCCSQDLTTTQ